MCEVLWCVRCCAAVCTAQSDSVSEEEEEVSFIHASSQRKKRSREETVDVSQSRSSLQFFLLIPLNYMMFVCLGYGWVGYFTFLYFLFSATCSVLCTCFFHVHVYTCIYL